MTDKDDKSTREKWLTAYDDMMMRVKTAIEEAEESTLPGLQRFIHNARDTAVELEELTKEESEKIAYYLQRDLQDAGKHLAETGHELSDWLRFDIHQVGMHLSQFCLHMLQLTTVTVQLHHRDDQSDERGQPNQRDCWAWRC